MAFTYRHSKIGILLVHRIYLFPFGLKSGKPREITNTQELLNIKSENMNTGVSVIFKIPNLYEHLICYETEIVVAIQLKLDENGERSFPYQVGKETDRYLAARLNLTKVHINKVNNIEVIDLLILPANELLNHTKWKK